MAGWKVLVMLAALACGGCRLFAGGLIGHVASKEAKVESDPSGAKVVLDGVLVGETPCLVTLNRSSEFTMEVIPPRHLPDTVRQVRAIRWVSVEESGSVLYFDLHRDEAEK